MDNSGAREKPRLLDFVRPGYKSALDLASSVTSSKPPASEASLLSHLQAGPVCPVLQGLDEEHVGFYMDAYT